MVFNKCLLLGVGRSGGTAGRWRELPMEDIRLWRTSNCGGHQPMQDIDPWRTSGYGGHQTMENMDTCGTLTRGGHQAMEDTRLWRTSNHAGRCPMEDVKLWRTPNCGEPQPMWGYGPTEATKGHGSWLHGGCCPTESPSPRLPQPHRSCWSMKVTSPQTSRRPRGPPEALNPCRPHTHNVLGLMTPSAPWRAETWGNPPPMETTNGSHLGPTGTTHPWRP